MPGAEGGVAPGLSRTPVTTIPQFYSIYTQLLPDLEQRPLFDALNFEASAWEFFFFAPSMIPGGGIGVESNTTVMRTSLSLLICPSDQPPGPTAETAGTSYRANLGLDLGYVASRTTAGPFGTRYPASPADVRDGMSQTVGFSERVRGTIERRRLDLRSTMLEPLAPVGPLEEIMKRCPHQDPQAIRFHPEAGLSWFIGTLSQTCYNHVQPPNSRTPDCLAVPYFQPGPGIITARSDHDGGVHAAMLDGSVRYVTDGVDPAVWRALGTRSGGEVISAGDFD